ncbi:MAG: hypothetical protein ACEPO2_20340 [Pelagibaca sp.]
MYVRALPAKPRIASNPYTWRAVFLCVTACLRKFKNYGWSIMLVSRWTAFIEIYVKVILSILFVIGAMLLLQSSLNHLKLRALVAEATSSRLQISAAAIEAAIVRADALGFAIDEMSGLQAFVDREQSRDPSIAQILIVSPIGSSILSSGLQEIPGSERDEVMRRVLASGDRITRLDVGPRLYTGRLLYDSSDAVMGAVILTSPTETFIDQARLAFHRMTNAYLIIFGMISVLIVPFIIFQFSAVRHAYQALVTDADAVLGHQPEDAETLRAAIDAGADAYAAAEAEFEAIMSDDPQQASERPA